MGFYRQVKDLSTRRRRAGRQRACSKGTVDASIRTPLIRARTQPWTKNRLFERIIRHGNTNADIAG
jgi:hypothetical protein